MCAEHQPPARRFAFYVRVWHEGSDATWRGSIQQTGTEGIHYFQNPEDMAAVIQHLCGWPAGTESAPDAQT